MHYCKSSNKVSIFKCLSVSRQYLVTSENQNSGIFLSDEVHEHMFLVSLGGSIDVTGATILNGSPKAHGNTATALHGSA